MDFYKGHLPQKSTKMLKSLIVPAVFFSFGLTLGSYYAKGEKLPEDEEFYDVAESERQAMVQRYNSWHQPIADWEKQGRNYIFHNKRKQVIKPRAYQLADSCYHLCKEDYDLFHEFQTWRESPASKTRTSN